MKRDMDLIRRLLLAVKENGYLSPLSYDNLGLTDEDLGDPWGVDYHLSLLVQADLITAEYVTRAAMTENVESRPVTVRTNTQIFNAAVIGLTWSGYEFLESIRDPAIWTKTKNGALAAGGFTLDLLKDLAKGLVKKQIEERTGVKL